MSVPEDTITLASTSDTQEEINAAIGIEPEVEEKVEETPEAEKPAEKKEADSDPAKDQKKGKGKHKWSKRVDTLTARNKRLEEELRQERAKKAAPVEADVEEEEVPSAKTEKPKVAERPKKEDFKSDDEYLEALIDWKAEQKVDKKLQDSKTEETQRQQQRQSEQVYAAYVDANAKFRREHPDFGEVVKKLEENDISIPQSVQVAIVEACRPDLTYYLAQHPEICEKLIKLSPSQAVLELGRVTAIVDAGLEKETPKPEEDDEELEEEEEEDTEKEKGSPAPKAEKEPAKGSAKPTVSKKVPVPTAAAPIKPVGSGGTKTSTPLDQVDFQEFKKRRARGETN